MQQCLKPVVTAQSSTYDTSEPLKNSHWGQFKMDRDNFDSAIRTFIERTPFRPFTVAMVNGDRLEIDHPNALAFREGIALFVAPGGVPIIFDHEGVSQIVGDLSGPRRHERRR